MSQSWLVAMGVDVPHPHGVGERTLLGHRLLLVLHDGPKSMRELHAPTGRVVAARELRSALAELQAVGLIERSIEPSGPHGGRPREVWRLLYRASAAVAAARSVVVARTVRGAQARRPKPWRPPTIPELRRAGLMPTEGGRRRRRRRKPVPADMADQIVDWLSEGNFLRDFCRRHGAPATRTVYAWAAKDPEFGRRLRQARDVGEESIRDSYMQLVDSPMAMAAFRGERQARRAFLRHHVRPLDLRLQRWRRHPRRPTRIGPG
jgi:hypothetical protein